MLNSAPASRYALPHALLDDGGYLLDGGRHELGQGEADLWGLCARHGLGTARWPEVHRLNEREMKPSFSAGDRTCKSS